MNRHANDLSLSLPIACLLVSHGSRDLRPQLALEQLAELVSTHLAREMGSALVATATLEFGLSPLEQQIQDFAHGVHAQGYAQIQILPLFLLPGVHVHEDIPAAVAIAQTDLPPDLHLRLCPYLGSHPGMLSLLRQQIARYDFPNWILLSHGSRRPQGNAAIAHLAEQLGILPAFWSTPPSLEHRVQELLAAGQNRIGILPYFLFQGTIMDAIAERVNHLQSLAIALDGELHLIPPLEPTPQLAHLIVECLQSTFSLTTL